ncbi:MAG: ComEC/Rec2 family competence protein, partial [Pseudomonadota bacterium]
MKMPAAALPGLSPSGVSGTLPRRIAAFAERALALELRRAILWFPVLMGLGIWVYFAWEAEPPAEAMALVLLPLGLFAVFAGLRRRLAPRTLLLALIALVGGHSAAQLSAWRAATPVLATALTVPIEGRVAVLDRSARGAPRVLLERVTLFGWAPERSPRRARISLMATPLAEAPRPGDWVQLTATLLPPGLPVEPGAFDFARRAYFERLGAVGFSRAPAMRVPVAEAVGAAGAGGAGGADPWFVRLRLGLARLRLEIADAIRARMPGAEGAFAAAIIVGDRAAIEEADAEALRISSLAHLLAISGLHMGMLTGMVFAAARLGLAAVPAVSLHWPVKKLAAAAAL